MSNTALDTALQELKAAISELPDKKQNIIADWLSTWAKYIRYERTYERIQLVVKKGEKDRIKDHAVKRKETLNGFVNRAINETMQRDNDEKEEG